MTTPPVVGWAPVLATAGRLLAIPAVERAPADVVHAVQRRRLRRMLQHAVTRVPRWQGVISAAQAARFDPRDLPALPMVSRRDLQAEDMTPWLDKALDPAALRWVQTSGSTGGRLRVAFSGADLAYLRAGYLSDLLALGLRPTDRIGYCRVGPFVSHPAERFGIGVGIHIPTTATLDEQVDRLQQAEPTFLIGFPNVLLSLAEELTRRGLRVPVRRVLLGGETTTPQARVMLAEVFGGTLGEVYSCVEAFTIARSCPRGRLHLRSAEVLAEVLRDDGTVSATGEGEILVTRLHGTAMPLLRYQLGDRVRIGDIGCDCSTYRTPVVSAVSGRTEDRLLARDGRLVHADYVVRAAIHPGVLRTQLRQERAGEAALLVQLDGRPDDGIVEAISAGVPHSGDLVIRVVVVDRIQTDANGKYRLVVRHGPLP